MRSLLRAIRPDPTHLTVEHDGARFAVALRRRPASKRMSLRVSNVDGEIVLTLPTGAKLGPARLFVDAHAGWIAARIARVPARTPFAIGAVLPLRGTPHRIVHASPNRRPTRIAMDPEAGSAIAVGGDAAGVPGRVRRFLAQEAAHDLAAHVGRYTEALGVKAARISIRDTKSRWGSCSSSGALSFSWRLILAPPLVLDYLAAHEVAHLKELNHSRRFWAHVHAICPHTDAAEAWLKRHGRELHAFG